MASTLRRLKIFFMYRWTGSVSNWLVAVAVLITFVYFLIGPKSFRADDDDDQREVEALKEILDAMTDTRPMRCRDHAFEYSRLDVHETVSIIAEFSGKSFYDIQLTLMSIVEHTPYDLYNEILVLDDGTTDSTIQRDLSSFLSNPQFNKVKIYKSAKRDGLTVSRFKLTAIAKSSILVFVHFRAVVNHGWLQPLLAKVISEPNVIAVPHYDNLIKGNMFEKVNQQLINVFTWNLSTVFIDSSYEKNAEMVDSPVMRGEVFVVRRSFLDQIGGFDDNLHQKEGTGNHIELSLRAWRCGGAIRMVACSRVAMKDMFEAQHITEQSDLYHIAQLWFDDYQPFVYRQAGVQDLMLKEKNSVTSRRQFLDTLPASCKSFSWYLQNVLKHSVPIPSIDAHKFGMLVEHSGYCLSTSIDASSENVLTHLCMDKHRNYQKHLLFEMNREGALFNDQLCVEPSNDGRVLLQMCEKDNPKQQWWLIESRLTPMTWPRKCLTNHVQYKQSGEVSHGLSSLEDCTGSGQQRWKFVIV